MNPLMRILAVVALAACDNSEEPANLTLEGYPVVATGQSHLFSLWASGSKSHDRVCLHSGCIWGYVDYRRIDHLNRLTVSSPCVLSNQSMGYTMVMFELSSDVPAVCEVSAELTLDNGLVLVSTTPVNFVKVETLDVQCQWGMCAGPFAWLEGAQASWNVTGRGFDASGQPVGVMITDLAASADENVVKVSAPYEGAAVTVRSVGTGAGKVVLTGGGARREVAVRVVSPSQVRAASLVPAPPIDTGHDLTDVEASPFNDGALPAEVTVDTNVALAVRAELDDGTLAVGDVDDLTVTREGELVRLRSSSATFDALHPGHCLVTSRVGTADARWEVEISPP
jgi:hypothetical protein